MPTNKSLRLPNVKAGVGMGAAVLVAFGVPVAGAGRTSNTTC